MIDVEVDVFNRIYEIAAPLCAPKRFVSTPIDSYVKLPAASLYEMDNRTVSWRQSSTATENYARVTYQLDVVAQDKAKCREIYSRIDAEMIAMNFIRVSGNYITYPGNTKVVRYVARYAAEVDPLGHLYRPGN